MNHGKNHGKMTVLLVDDEPQVTTAIKRSLYKEPFTVFTAQSGEQALDILDREQVDVVVSDEVMLGMSGSELLTRVSQKYPEVIRIILTGQASMDTTVRAINEGRIFRFLFKPCSDAQLSAVLLDALQEIERKKLRSALILRAGRIAAWELNIVTGAFQYSENMPSFLGITDSDPLADFNDMIQAFPPHERNLIRHALQTAIDGGHGFDIDHCIPIGDGVERWISHTADVLLDKSGRTMRLVGVLKDTTEKKQDEKNLRCSLENLKAMLASTVHALGMTVEKRDPYTSGHQERVTRLACAIAREMGLDREHIEGLHAAGILHDIGKICVPVEILTKPSLLSELEMAIMKTHPAIGYEILKDIPFSQPVAQIVLQHHERMDGTGYPAGLQGKDILREARILAVADVVEAMASHRPYRASLGMEKAIEEIRKNAGQLYDAEVVAKCLSMTARLDRIISGKDE